MTLFLQGFGLLKSKFLGDLGFEPCSCKHSVIWSQDVTAEPRFREFWDFALYHLDTKQKMAKKSHKILIENNYQ